MIEMAAGTLLALIALSFVLYPLFREPLGIQPPRIVLGNGPRVTTAVDALREIEFDHATGKLSERDYAELKAEYTQQAVTAMRAGVTDAVICERCGPRPERNASFCSECGRRLAA